MTKKEKFIKFLEGLGKILNVCMLYIPKILIALGRVISLLTPKGKEVEAKRQVKINENKVMKLERKMDKTNTKIQNTTSKLEVKKERVELLQAKRKTK